MAFFQGELEPTPSPPPYFSPDRSTPLVLTLLVLVTSNSRTLPSKRRRDECVHSPPFPLPVTRLLYSIVKCIVIELQLNSNSAYINSQCGIVSTNPSRKINHANGEVVGIRMKYKFYEYLNVKIFIFL